MTMWSSIDRRNIFLFYLLSAVMNFWFIASNWIYFWTRYMTFGQLGWVDALGFGFALLLEVPSGAIADLLGKRKTILFGMIAGSIGVGIITFSDNLSAIFIGWLITQICFAFYSGAAEALAYDSLADAGKEDEFNKVISRSSEIESYAVAITTFIGGFLYAINFRLPHILWGIGFALGALCSWFLLEPKTDTIKFSFKEYFQQLFVGVKELTQTGLRRYLGFFFVLVGVYFLYAWGFVRPAIATGFGFYAKEQAVILPALTILGAFVVRFTPFLRNRLSDIAGLVILALMMSAGFVLASFPVGIYGLISMVLIAIAGKLATPWISILVNRKIDKKHRATTLSTVALLTKLPYVLLAVKAGKMIETGTLRQFTLIVGMGVLLVAVISWLIVQTRKNFPLHRAEVTN